MFLSGRAERPNVLATLRQRREIDDTQSFDCGHGDGRSGDGRKQMGI